ncbi:MAG: Kelch repeat-containing protein [Candidatus Hodarchaeales archaeon]|jgi:N-acetylneuraminic acid mutarotase
MVYDSNRNITILFGGMIGNGGSVLSDTWEFNSSNQVWNKVKTEGNPSGRFNFGFAFDSNNQKVILFGGMNSNYDRSDEMWVYDPSDRIWSKLSPQIHPSPRSDPEMVYDSDNNIIILFGGYNIDETLLDDTWIYFINNNTWKERFPEMGPEARYGHSMCYQTQKQRTILFGGRVEGLTNEIWEYDYLTNSWEELLLNEKPSVRYWHDMVYNPADNSLLLFGGDNDQFPLRALADTWVLNISANEWIEVSPHSNPEARNGHTMVYDLQSRQSILFGGLGEDYQKNYQNTWSFSYTSREWEELTI